jgi:WXG100 family type VII secretion target
MRAEFDSLKQMARIFRRQADDIQKSQKKLQRNMSTLQAGDWIGVGADKFYQEMEADVLPAVKRLGRAMDSGERVTNQIAKIWEEADEEASRLFGDDGFLAMIAAGAAALGSAVAGGIAAVADAIANAAAVNSVFSGNSSKKDAPSSISIPDSLNEGAKGTWKDSFPAGHEQEQGGILIRTKDGEYKFIRGDPGTGGTWDPNFGDIGDNELVGTVHTHPYDEGDTDVPFSKADISFFFDSNLKAKNMEEMMMVQSGDGQFMLARTAEFNKMVEGKSAAEISKLTSGMESTYDNAVAAGEKKGLSFAARHDAAVKAVADKYSLLYYKGKDGNLKLQ